VTTYSAVEDLVTGSIPLPTYLDVPGAVQDATDEIDSRIGLIYKTPVDMSEDGPVSRPGRLLLKRIANFLASGRLLLQVAAPGEQTELHAYAKSLVDEAHAGIEAICNGTIALEGAEQVELEQRRSNTPLIANVDPSSNVEDFYNKFTTPQFTLPSSFLGAGG